MSPKSLRVLVLVVAILIVILLVARFASKPSKALKLAPGFMPARVDQVRIESSAGKYTLTRSSQTWRLESPTPYPADSSAMKDALNQLAEAELSDALTTDPARYALFGLSESNAVKVTVIAARQQPTFNPVTFLMGKDGPDRNSSFVRFPGQTEVYEAQRLPASAFEKPLEDWMDKTLCEGSSADLDRLSISSSLGKVELNRQSDGWHLGSSKVAVSTGAANQFIQPAAQTLKSLSADKLILAANLSKAMTESLKHPEMTVEAHGTGWPQTCVLKFGKKDGTNEIMVQRVGESRVYFQIHDWHLDPLQKKDLFRVR